MIIVVALILTLLTILLGRESFAAKNVLYSINRLNYDLWAHTQTNQQYDVESIPISSWNIIKQTLQVSGTLPNVYTEGRSSVLLALDPMDAASLKPKLPSPVAQGPEGYFVIIMDPRKARYQSCNIQFTGSRIGWYDISDYHLLKAFQGGYRIPSHAMELVPMSLQDIMNLSDALMKGGAEGGLDYMVTYVVPNSAYCRLLKTLSVAISGFQDINLDRIKLFHPYVSSKTVDLRSIFMDDARSSKAVVSTKSNSYPVLMMRLPLFVLFGTQPILRETFITQFKADEEAFDPRYTCYGDSRVESKAECNSNYDVIGLPKRYDSVWDRPCTQDSDCPFYQVNKNYPNQRGGCLKSGVCEMPVGTQRVSYQKVVIGDAFQPFCYNCNTAEDPECCKKIKNPDYAFPNDYEDRVQYGLPVNLSVE